MKKSLLSLTFCMTAYITNAQNVNIPDANFKSYLTNNASININADSEIQLSEAQTYSGSIIVNSANISYLTGIEAFVALKGLQCNMNQLSTLNLSSNTALTTLQCNYNQLTSIDVSNNNLLVDFRCRNNQLTSLNVSNNTALITFQCHYNQLTALNVSNNTNLIELQFNHNQITTINLSANTNLQYLTCHNNALTGLDVTNNADLLDIYCSYNQLTALDVSNNVNLEYLTCDNNQLTILDAKDNTGLVWLKSNNNQLTSLSIKNGNNVNMSNNAFDARNNTNLTCIEVDNAILSASNYTNIDPIVSFNENCGTTTSLTNLSILNKFNIYPNPNNGEFTIQSQNLDVVNIINDLGQTIQTVELNQQNNFSFKVNSLPNGIYFLIGEKFKSKVIVTK